MTSTQRTARRVLLVLKALALLWPAAAFLVIWSPQWLTALSAFAPLALCAFALGVALPEAFRAPAPATDGFHSLGSKATVGSALTALATGAATTAVLVRDCEAPPAGTALALVCGPELVYAWSFVTTAYFVALVDAIYLALLFWRRARTPARRT